MKLARYVLICLVMINFTVHVPFLSRPALGDETIYYGITQTIARNRFNPINNYKPPVMFLLPSVFMKIAPSLIWGRIEILIAASVALIYIYLLAEFLYTPFVGILAVVLCIFFPLFTVQSVIFLDPIPQTAALFATLYYFFTKQKKGYLICATLMVLTKEPMILVPILVFMYTAVRNFRHAGSIQRSQIRRYLYLLFPLAAFVVWIMLNKLMFGYFLEPGNVKFLSTALQSLHYEGTHLPSYIQYFTQLGGGGIIFSLGSLFYIDYYIRKNKHKTHRENEALGIFLILITVYIPLYQLYSHTSIRYVLFIYPLVFMLFSNIINDYFSKIISVGIIAFICLGFINYQWYEMTNAPYLPDPEDIRFIPLQQFNFKIMKEINSLSNNQPIAVEWPISRYFTDPLYGYVTSPFKKIIEIAPNIQPVETLHSILPHRQKILLILTYISHDSYVTLVSTVSPDWPKTTSNKYYVYDYYNPEP